MTSPASCSCEPQRIVGGCAICNGVSVVSDAGSVLVERLTAVRNRLLDRGDYDAHGADVVDATTIGEAIEELRQLRALAQTRQFGEREG